MVGGRVQANDVTFMGVLKACANLASLPHGKLVHFCTLNNGSESDAFVASSLVDLYAKCGAMEDACRLFYKLDKGDVVFWNVMVVGYAQHGHGRKALKFVSQMQCEGIVSNEVTYASIFKGCGSMQNLWHGKCVHALLTKSGFETVLVVQNALVDMYIKCGSVAAAYDVFCSMSKRDTVTWNAMIAGYAEHGLIAEAFQTFGEMRRNEIELDEVTYLNIMKACQCSAALENCKQIHSLLQQIGLKPNTLLQNTLINMYAKCGNLNGARQVFDAMRTRDAVSWAVMITSYTQYELFEEAVKLFVKLIQEDLKPNEEAFVAVLKACGSLATLEEGKRIHSQCVESGFNDYIQVENNMIDMYAKGGSLEDARTVFEQMFERDTTSWIVMVMGLAQHGHGKQALDLFEHMNIFDVNLGGVVFLGVLNACSHAGLFYEGCHLFNFMVSECGVTPTAEQYACLIDLFCRVGCLDGAVSFLERIPFQPTGVAWTSLLSVCRVHLDTKLAKCVTEHVLELEPENAGVLVTLANIFSIHGQ